MRRIGLQLSVGNSWFANLVRDKWDLVPLLPVTVAFILGIVLGPREDLFLLLMCSYVCFVLSYALLRFKLISRTILMVAIVFLGLFFVSRREQKLSVSFPSQVQEFTVVVEDSPKKNAYGVAFPCVITGRKDKLDGQLIRCTLCETEFLPDVGQTLQISGRLKANGNYRNGNFDYLRWAKSHGYVGRIAVYGNRFQMCSDALEGLSPFTRIGIKAKILRARILHALVNDGLIGEEHALVSAMAFGDRAELTDSVREIFAVTGVAHLLALSGMHLGILFSMLSFLFVDSRRRLLGQVCVMTTIWMYVLLAGMPVSLIRAAAMLTLYSVVSLLDRQRMSVNALCTIALIMLMCNPMALWDVGFELSFVAMLGICVYFKPLYNIIGVEFLFEHPVFRKVWGLVCMSVSAQIATIPLSVFYFGRLPLLTIVTNLLAIPLVFLLLYVVFASLLFWFIPFAKVFLLKCAGIIAGGLIKILHMLSECEYVSIENISINWIQLMLIYMMIIVLSIMMVFVWHLHKINKLRRQTTNSYSMLK